MKIQPLFNNILIKVEKNEERTVGGIVLPDSITKEKPQIGNVIAVGIGGKEQIIVKPGAKILFKKWGGNEVKMDKEEFILIEQEDILAILE